MSLFDEPRTNLGYLLIKFVERGIIDENEARTIVFNSVFPELADDLLPEPAEPTVEP